MAEKVGNKKEVRRQRRQVEKAQRARAALREKIMVGGGLAVIVLLVGVVLFQQVNPANQPGTAVLDQGNQHLSAVDEPHVPYNTTPPTSGPHMPGLWKWGVSEEPVPNEWQIHNLEDGGVVIQYDCPDGCPDITAELTALVSETLLSRQFANPTTGETHLILAPYSGFRDLPASNGSRIALTAWTRILYLDTVDREKILEFMRAYINVDHHVRGVG